MTAALTGCPTAIFWAASSLLTSVCSTNGSPHQRGCMGNDGPFLGITGRHLEPGNRTLTSTSEAALATSPELTPRAPVKKKIAVRFLFDIRFRMRYTSPHVERQV